ncbi:MAG TPA: DNA-3-methyladenine glycosylase [Rhodanobacteraceae bacterium]|nr:DNA-3-methyladenine glycosylase [Rhodanobacteraceae bacterium]
MTTRVATRGAKAPAGQLAGALEPLPRRFYARKTVPVARDLLGKWLVHRIDGQTRIGRIVEVEAYLGPGDLAAHTARGRTPRTRAMFGPPGHAYVYLVYGLHHCMNVVTEPEGVGTAVLLRALEPIANLPGSASGPGRLCKAMGIDLAHYGHDLVGDTLFIAKAPIASALSIGTSARIGVDYAGEWARKPLRFYIEGNRFVSKASAPRKAPKRVARTRSRV